MMVTDINSNQEFRHCIILVPTLLPLFSAAVVGNVLCCLAGSDTRNSALVPASSPLPPAPPMWDSMVPIPLYYVPCSKRQHRGKKVEKEKGGSPGSQWKACVESRKTP